ncbi:MAG TPA: YwiC-like family protein [Bryobacteraceae bacterium]|nr:YwiC-like family protein [Bryobacteraceae bacterium]
MSAGERRRSLVFPREHGAWGILLVPLATGAATGLLNGGHALPLLPLTIAALALFWLRTPVESWIGTTPVRARTPAELRTVRIAVLLLSSASVAALLLLVQGGRNLGLFWIGGIAAAAFAWQAVLKRVSRSARAAAQMIGAAGLTAAAPAAYYVTTGDLGWTAYFLWVANFLFAANQIHFVQVRIRAAHAEKQREKFLVGRWFLAGQAALVALLAAGVARHLIGSYTALAFAPVLLRGFAWFATKPRPLRIRALGVSELIHNAVFGVLLVVGLELSPADVILETMGWQWRAAFIAELVERQIDRYRQAVKRQFGWMDPPILVSYLGYGTAERLYLKGRVIEESGVRSALDTDSIWDNLRMMYRRIASREIPGARVEARFQGRTLQAVTDEEGFVRFHLTPEQPPPAGELWHAVELRLLEPKGPREVRATGSILAAPAGAAFGVISDIDDTVVKTDAANLLKMARIVSLGNARTRMPFPGVAAFYRALQVGRNPIFYVSSSPWNLYDLLRDFLELKELPLGPLLLRDWGITKDEVLPTRHASHKTDALRHILQLYPDLPFILIGDSGQEDPEVYSRAVEEFGARILAIYIRDVSARRPARRESIQELARKTLAAGCPLLLVEDTLAAARHAAERGWINGSSLKEVAGEISKDEGPPRTELDIVNEDQDR